jgi:hypothetical protein
MDRLDKNLDPNFGKLERWCSELRTEPPNKVLEGEGPYGFLRNRGP